MAAAAALLTSWSNAGENAALGADEPKTVSEGVDTKCEITGYEPYQGPVGSYFLSEGDKVAVISPSQLPTRAQADATVEGLKKWGFVPVEGKYVCPPVRTLDEQLEDLEWALNDPEIKAIFCVRGGYGSTATSLPTRASRLSDTAILPSITRRGRKRACRRSIRV